MAKVGRNRLQHDEAHLITRTAWQEDVGDNRSTEAGGGLRRGSTLAMGDGGGWGRRRLREGRLSGG